MNCLSRKRAYLCSCSMIDQHLSGEFDNTQTGYTQAMYWFSQLHPSFVDREVWSQCITLFGEAFENVVYHTQKLSTVDVDVRITEEMLEIKVWDYGNGFDFEKCLDVLPDTVSYEAEHGRGLWIMVQVADYLSYSRMSGNRNCLELQKLWST